MKRTVLFLLLLFELQMWVIRQRKPRKLGYTDFQRFYKGMFKDLPILKYTVSKELFINEKKYQLMEELLEQQQDYQKRL